MAFYQLFGVVVLGLVCRFLEDGKKITADKKCFALKNSGNTVAFYECLNIHLTLSLGILGLVWGIKDSLNWAFPIMIFILIGVCSKGVFSSHKPDSLSWRDNDALCGMIIPNGCAFTCLIIALCAFLNCNHK